MFATVVGVCVGGRMRQSKKKKKKLRKNTENIFFFTENKTEVRVIVISHT